VRARWKIEDLARGQWQLVVTELPPGTSAQKVLEEIEELTNPKVKPARRRSRRSRCSSRPAGAGGAGRGARRVSKDAPVRLVFEPKSRTVEQQELITTLLAHTSLETSVPST
jgi:topoisomerase-4 subunit A